MSYDAYCDFHRERIARVPRTWRAHADQVLRAILAHERKGIYDGSMPSLQTYLERHAAVIIGYERMRAIIDELVRAGLIMKDAAFNKARRGLHLVVMKAGQSNPVKMIQRLIGLVGDYRSRRTKRLAAQAKQMEIPCPRPCPPREETPLESHVRAHVCQKSSSINTEQPKQTPSAQHETEQQRRSRLRRLGFSVA